MRWVVRRGGKVVGKLEGPPDRGQASILARRRFGRGVRAQSQADYDLEQEEASAAARERRRRQEVGW